MSRIPVQDDEAFGEEDAEAIQDQHPAEERRLSLEGKALRQAKIKVPGQGEEDESHCEEETRLLRVHKDKASLSQSLPLSSNM